MTILALEFSSERRSVALARNGAVLSEAVEQTGGRGTKAFNLIERVLSEAGITRSEIEVIAVGLGPGSYTGIRAAISLAQGWQLATGAKLLGVSSAEAMAAQAQAEDIRGEVSVVIDAQRGEFYLATWELSADQRMEISPLKIVSGSEIEILKSAGRVFVGPDANASKVVFPTATMVAKLATSRTDFLQASEMVPIYLRETTFVKAPPARPVF